MGRKLFALTWNVYAHGNLSVKFDVAVDGTMSGDWACYILLLLFSSSLLVLRLCVLLRSVLILTKMCSICWPFVPPLLSLFFVTLLVIHISVLNNVLNVVETCLLSHNKYTLLDLFVKQCYMLSWFMLIIISVIK